MTTRTTSERHAHLPQESGLPVCEPGLLARLVYPSPCAIASRNAYAFVVLFLLVPVHGVLLYKSVALISVWAFISLALGRFPSRLSPTDRLVGFSCLILTGVIMGVDLALNPALSALSKATSSLFFVAPFFLIQRMRVLDRRSILRWAYLGGAIGGVIILPIVLVQHYVLMEVRVSGLSRNEGPFSILTLVSFGLSCLHVGASRKPVENAIGAVGALGSLLALLLTGMRGAWPALIVIVPVVLWARRGDMKALWARQRPSVRAFAVCGILVCLLGLLVISGPAIFQRFAQLGGNIALLDQDPTAQNSLSIRLDLYNAALRAIAEQPWFGYGISAQWKAVAPYLTPQIIGDRSFNHMHNIVLSVLIDAGLLGIVALAAVLAAPLVVAWRWRRAEGGEDRLAFALVVLAAFVIPGMTNVMFFYPILDGLWVLCVSTLCAATPYRASDLAPDRPPQEPAEAR